METGDRRVASTQNQPGCTVGANRRYQIHLLRLHIHHHLHDDDDHVRHILENQVSEMTIPQNPSRFTISLLRLPIATRPINSLRPHQRGPFLLQSMEKPTRPGIGFMATSLPQSPSPLWSSMAVSMTPAALHLWERSYMCQSVLLLGPGITHEYLIPVSDLQETRPVIFYDQLGNGRSTHLPNKPKTFWTIDLFIDELVNLVNYFGISSRYDILGHSWGGMLASELVIRRQPTGLRKLVIADSLCSMESWDESNRILQKALPEEVQADLKLGFKDKVRYRKALEIHYSRHGCILNPPPEEIASAVVNPLLGDRETGEGGDPTVYIAMCVLFCQHHVSCSSDRGSSVCG